MKQHISVEQMQEIDSDILEKLLNDDKFTRGLETLCLITSDDDDRPRLLYEMSCVLTIGKIIELLEHLNPVVAKEIIWTGNSYEYTGKWDLEIDPIIKYIPRKFKSIELIDALFEAFVYVLESESE